MTRSTLVTMVEHDRVIVYLNDEKGLGLNKLLDMTSSDAFQFANDLISAASQIMSKQLDALPVKFPPF